MKRLIILSLAALVLAAADPLRANAILLNSGTGNLGAVANNRGYDFTVGSSAITVTALGLWDGPEFSAQGFVIGSVGDGFASAHTVGLWDNSGNLLAESVMQLGTLDPLVGEFRYSSTLIVTNPGPLILSAGTTYVLGATFPQGNTDFVKFDNSSQLSVDPAVTSGNQRTSMGAFGFPATVSNPGAIVGPNALFTVPEDGNTFGLMLLAIASFFVARRFVAVDRTLERSL